MSAQPSPDLPPSALTISDDEVEEVLREVGGDPREAIRILLRDLAVMAMDADEATSKGFLRGRFSAGARRPPFVEPV